MSEWDCSIYLFILLGKSFVIRAVCHFHMFILLQFCVVFKNVSLIPRLPALWMEECQGKTHNRPQVAGRPCYTGSLTMEAFVLVPWKRLLD